MKFFEPVVECGCRAFVLAAFSSYIGWRLIESVLTVLIDGSAHKAWDADLLLEPWEQVFFFTVVMEIQHPMPQERVLDKV